MTTATSKARSRPTTRGMLAAIVASSRDPIIGTALDGTITIWNEAAEAMLGYTANERIGQAITAIVPPEHAAKLAESYRKLRNGQPRHTIEMLCLRRDNLPIRASLTLTAAQDRRGRMIGAYAIVHDAAELAQANQALHEALAEKEVLIREVHHRVKNNLQTIISLLNLQMRGIDSEYLRQQFQDAQSRIKALSLVHNLVYLSNDLVHIEVPQLFENICKQLFQTYDGTSRPIRWAVDIPRLHTNVDCAIALALLATEAITNSLKHAFPDGAAGTVRIGLEERGEKVILSISDDGVGFRRGAMDASDRRSLGLTLIRALATQLGADVRICGSDGVAIQLTLPRDRFLADFGPYMTGGTDGYGKNPHGRG